MTNALACPIGIASSRSRHAARARADRARGGAAVAAPADDAYLRGYATAVLEQTLGIRAPAHQRGQWRRPPVRERDRVRRIGTGSSPRYGAFPA